MAIYSWLTHEKWWFSIAMLVYQRVKITIALQQWSSFDTRLLGGHRHLLPILGLGCSQAIQLAPCEARGWGCIKLPMKLPYRRWTNYSNPCNPITPLHRTPNYNVVFLVWFAPSNGRKNQTIRSGTKIRNDHVEIWGTGGSLQLMDAGFE